MSETAFRSKTRTQCSPACFHKPLLQWYSVHRRSFPWRSTHKPYNILVSEIMLQQTQAHRVVGFYKRWLKKFPTFRSLTHASRGDALRAWAGLGYNNRAIRLQELARYVVTQYRSQLPNNPEELQRLPGIGKYTAYAIACFAFGKSVPVVDVNVKRILTRWLNEVKIPHEMVSDNEAWKLAEQLLPAHRAYDWNQALMDFGSLVCTSRRPHCAECPVQQYCRSAFSPLFRQSVTREKKREPSRKGIPRRLYRGKILTLLHTTPRTPHEIAAELWKKFSHHDVHWLTEVLEQMCSDGIVRRKRTKYAIAE